MADVVAADIFDLSRFRLGEFRDTYERVSAAEQYLMENCNTLDIQNLSGAVNPVKLRAARLELPSVNSHGELELFVTTAGRKIYDSAKHHRTPFRSMPSLPEGVVLCIDTNHVFGFREMTDHPYMLLNSIMVYGNVRKSLESRRHVPGYQPHFLEIGALSYSDIGNSWTHGVYGKNFKGTARAEE